MGAVDVLTRGFRHYMALAVDLQRGPRGATAAKMTCVMPEMLVAELLEGINEVEKIKGKVVLGLSAGFQSLTEMVLAMGGKYVAVVVAGQRPVKAAEPLRGAVVLRQGNKCLSILIVIKTDGKMRWSMSKGSVTAADASQHHAGVRVLEEVLGLKEGQWCEWVSGSHATTALERTTYYTYNINQSVPLVTPLGTEKRS